MTTIIIRNSTVASHAPTAGQLALGELAVNIPDGKLYVGQGTASPAVLLTVAGAPGAAGTPGTPGTPAPPAPTGTGGTGSPTCFLAGTMIEMMDGSFRPIEVVMPGMYVRGRFGEANRVIGIERPPLGDRPMYRINDKLWNTSDHMIWSSRGWSAIDKKEHFIRDQGYMPALLESGKWEMVLYEGVTEAECLELRLGDLIGTAAGYEELRALEPRAFPAETQLFNLLLAGSHMMRCNGLLMGGWPNARDFDYVRWEERLRSAA